MAATLREATMPVSGGPRARLFRRLRSGKSSPLRRRAPSGAPVPAGGVTGVATAHSGGGVRGKREARQHPTELIRTFRGGDFRGGDKKMHNKCFL